jgi:thiol:disulfide interchange protein DsbC
MIRHPFIATAMTSLLLISSAWAAAPDAATLEKQWAELLAGAKIENIQASPIDGLWEVDAGAHIFYANEKGDKLIFGDVLALNDKEGYTNLTEESRKKIRLEILKGLDKKDMIIYAAEKPKHNVYVFTDADCGYCRKFHEERATLNKAGITINYLAMPRTPQGTPSYNKAVAIWCATDRNKALDEAKDNKFKDAEKTCPEGEKIIAADVNLAKQFGAQGTPTIVLENGEVIPGYVPAEKLIEYYAQEKPTTAAAD